MAEASLELIRRTSDILLMSGVLSRAFSLLEGRKDCLLEV